MMVSNIAIHGRRSAKDIDQRRSDQPVRRKVPGDVKVHNPNKIFAPAVRMLRSVAMASSEIF
jgi:hypothetical protein